MNGAFSDAAFSIAAFSIEAFDFGPLAPEPTPPVAATPFLVDVSVGQGLDWKRKKRKKQLFLLLG